MRLVCHPDREGGTWGAGGAQHGQAGAAGLRGGGGGRGGSGVAGRRALNTGPLSASGVAELVRHILDLTRREIHGK